MYHIFGPSVQNWPTGTRKKIEKRESDIIALMVCAIVKLSSQGVSASVSDGLLWIAPFHPFLGDCVFV